MLQKKIKIWVDEAGRWPWAWPVVACSLFFGTTNPPAKSFIKKLDDSKKLSEKKRQELFEQIIEYSRGENPSLYFWVWVVDNYMIDEINIRQANKEAMRRSLVEALRKIKHNPEKKQKIEVVIDGRDNYEFEELEKKPLYIVWGDGKVSEISAASIVAKVFRDKMLDTYSLIYPDMNLENHKWYWTKKHREYLSDASQVSWIHRCSYKPVKETLEKKEKILLHICCGPDATVPIMDLKKDYEVICFWYDPNIQPKKEHDKRLWELKKVCAIEWVDFIEGEYDVLNFFEKIAWLEDTPEKWEKCTECYDMRLKRTALEAQKLGIKYWTSTLNTSPHKDLEKMFALGDKHSLKNNLEFLKIAFRKNGWFQRSVDYTKKHNIYRQNYCWCIYSDTYPWGRREAPKTKK